MFTSFLALASFSFLKSSNNFFLDFSSDSLDFSDANFSFLSSNFFSNLSKVLLTSPRGKTFSQETALSLSKEQHLIFICGHYEGIDERVNKYVDELVSIGDFILTGGEVPVMAMSDSIIRLIKGVISEESIEDESFNNGLLEYPQYTFPYDYEGDTIPDILFSGNHAAIEKYRKKQSLVLTRTHRPDLFSKYNLTKQDKKLLEEYDSKITPKWETDALEKGHKFIKNKGDK